MFQAEKHGKKITYKKQRNRILAWGSILFPCYDFDPLGFAGSTLTLAPFIRDCLKASYTKGATSSVTSKKVNLSNISILPTDLGGIPTISDISFTKSCGLISTFRPTFMKKRT